MGIDVIKLSEGREAAALRPQDMAKLSFSLHSISAPPMSVWLMAMPNTGQPIFPWWSYGRALDEDANKLSAMTGVTSPQGLFDFLFLLQLKRAFPNGLYALVPGNVKTEGWANLNEPARGALQRGQSCLYRLEGTLSNRVSVNWVPFFQPQCMVKDPSGDSLVRFFNAAKTDDVANSLSFVAVDDVRKMPQIVNLLVQPDDKRSEKMAQIADWFGVYSSPLDDRHGSCAMTYTMSKAAAAAFMMFERQFVATIDAARQALMADATPNTVLKLVSRLVAL